MQATRAQRILNREAGFEKYSQEEAARLLEGLTVLLRAVESSASNDRSANRSSQLELVHAKGSALHARLDR